MRTSVQLRVAEAGVGAVATALRLNSQDLARLGVIAPEAWVLLHGRQQAVMALATTGDDSVPAGALRLDGLLRENVGASIDDMIEVQVVCPLPAIEVVLAASFDDAPARPVVRTRGVAAWIERLRRKREQIPGPHASELAQLLAGDALLAGNRVRLSIQGQRLNYRVVTTQPPGPVLMEPETTVRIVVDANSRERSMAVSYDDVGGLAAEIARVREVVELPLRHPELFKQLGVDPPKGVLLHGPPGCGKTLIARAVAHEAGCRFITVNGPEIIQQHYGESEAQLRSIFEAAYENAPSIIFLDELDAIAPNRDSVLGDVEKRVVAQLLALMDGLNARGQVVVLAATNLPNSIDPALRRPGRFDREIGIGTPNKEGRLEILRIHTRQMPLAIDVNLERLAARTHGFLGADLAALCREAAMLCAQNAIAELQPSADATSIDPRALKGLRIQMNHFEQAQGEIDLSTMRQVFTEIPDVTWADVGGLNSVRELLREVVELPMQHASRFEHLRVRAPKGVLLTGAPGTGKTLVAKAVAAESGVNFISVKGPELLSKWVGESEKGLREIFKKARQSAPSIVFFDEIDALVPARGKSDGGGQVAERMVGQFLLEMDSIDEMRGVVVLGASNRPELVDQALLRPGRFDYVIELPLPDEAARQEILAVHCRDRRVAASVNLEKIARETEGFSGADLEALCRRAATTAIRESIEREPTATFSPFEILQPHFIRAFETIRTTRS